MTVKARDSGALRITRAFAVARSIMKRLSSMSDTALMIDVTEPLLSRKKGRDSAASQFAMARSTIKNLGSMSDIALMIDVTERLLPRKGSPDSAASQLAAFSMMIREAPKFTGQKIPESAGRLGVVLSPEGASQKVSVVDEKGAGKQTEKVLPTSTSLDYRLRLPSALKSLGLEPRRTQSPLQKNVATLARAEEVCQRLIESRMERRLWGISTRSCDRD